MQRTRNLLDDVDEMELTRHDDVEVSCRVVSKSEGGRALRVSVPAPGGFREVWIASSLIRRREDHTSGVSTIVVPFWLAHKEGLI